MLNTGELCPPLPRHQSPTLMSGVTLSGLDCTVPLFHRLPVSRRIGSPRHLAATALATATLRARLVTAASRSLPDFLVVGAQKAGTTSFYTYLTQHPAVAAPYRKEVHYFDLNYDRQERWYRAFFPYRAELRRKQAITGEASPYYLFHPAAARRIHGLVPEAKIIILLRDPAKRALSHYAHESRLGNEPLALPEALAAERHRVTEDAETNLQAPNARSWAHQHYSYCTRGLYLSQIRRYFALFGRERCRVIVSEELFHDPVVTIRETAEFLAIDPNVPPVDLAPKGVNKTRASSAQAHKKALAELRAFFAPANRELAEYLGRELPWPPS